MKKHHSYVTAACLVITAFLLADSVFAQNNLSGAVSQQISAGAKGADIGAPVDPRVFIADIIKIMLTAIGSIFTFLIILGGYWWLTDRGEEERVQKAKKTLTAAVAGLIVVLISYSITLFVGNAARRAATGNTQEQQYNIQLKCGVIDLIRGTCDRSNLQRSL